MVYWHDPCSYPPLRHGQTVLVGNHLEEACHNFFCHSRPWCHRRGKLCHAFSWLTPTCKLDILTFSVNLRFSTHNFTIISQTLTTLNNHSAISQPSSSHMLNHDHSTTMPEPPGLPRPSLRQVLLLCILYIYIHSAVHVVAILLTIQQLIRFR